MTERTTKILGMTWCLLCRQLLCFSTIRSWPRSHDSALGAVYLQSWYSENGHLEPSILKWYPNYRDLRVPTVRELWPFTKLSVYLQIEELKIYVQPLSYPPPLSAGINAISLQQRIAAGKKLEGEGVGRFTTQSSLRFLPRRWRNHACGCQVRTQSIDYPHQWTAGTASRCKDRQPCQKLYLFYFIVEESGTGHKVG